MTDPAFARFFSRLSAGEPAPYPYQETLATGAQLPDLLVVPTGAGKTLAVFAAWLYRRRMHPDAAVREATPRRLVYCLPMRVLVEQTRDVVHDALERLGMLAEEGTLLDQDPNRVGLHVLFGGEIDREFVAHPERDAVVVGTQDLLLSRALNRGYAESRYRWPLSFALVSNDSLWVLDEVQLMGAGLPTTCQLAAFRHEWKTFGPSHTLWMSATVTPAALATVDHPVPKRVLSLAEDDRRDERLARRLNAKKKLLQAAPILRKTGGKELDAHLSGLAAQIREKHRPATLTLAIVNTVNRARELYLKLRTSSKRKPGVSGPEVLLLHSRFRPGDRQRILERIFADPPPEGIVLVATQVVEAGADVSARCLFSELAPWPSMVQRFGRCNRAGTDDDAEIFWIDIATDDEESARPYDPVDLQDARERLKVLDDVGPGNLQPVDLRLASTHVPRRRDVLELFDTTPDISGGDIDVSRFVRDTDDRTLHVFWRDLPEGPSRDLGGAERHELCTAPVFELRTLLERTSSEGLRNGWMWDVLDGEWVPVDRQRLRPGLIVLLRSSGGGYSSETGWAPDLRERVQPLEIAEARGEECADCDDASFWKGGGWVELAQHLDDVELEAATICRGLSLDEGRSAVVRTAARWHDAGKVHEAFQHTITKGVIRAGGPWAKSPPENRGRHMLRPRLRHELASALALVANADVALPAQTGSERDLIAYLVAAHHGKVRLAIRSVPGEMVPPGGRRFALGIWDGDELAATDLGGGVKLPVTRLSLEAMSLGLDANGTPTWTDRALALLAELGPFRLAYLEALVISADWRGSQRAVARNQRVGDRDA